MWSRCFVVWLSLLASVTSAAANEVEAEAEALNDNCEELASPLTIRGKKFYNAEGRYVPIKGVNYYPRPNEGVLTTTNSVDFFTDTFSHVWQRDVANLRKLGVNAVRIYAVDPSKNHDAFMCALKSAGIYVMVGLSAECENCAVRKDVAPPHCYPGELKQRGQFIIEQFSQYTNLLGFSVTNEASLDIDEGVHVNGPCQKRFLRDMKAFVRACKKTTREIPIGIILADPDPRPAHLGLEMPFYNCQARPNDKTESLWDVADFIGINSYTHCDGNAALGDELPGYGTLLADVASYNLTVPLLLTEFGCVNPSFPTIGGYEAQRTWLQIPRIYSEDFRQHFAGAFVFEYSTELAIAENYGQVRTTWPFLKYGERNHGLGYLTPPNCNDVDNFCLYEKYPQFDILAARFAAVDTSDEPMLDDYESSLTNGDTTVSSANSQALPHSPPTCPAVFKSWTDFKWEADDRETFFDWSCPRSSYIILCPGISEQCLTFAPTGSSATAPTAAPVMPLTLSTLAVAAAVGGMV